MNNPLVSILLPVYNGEKYIGECIDSLLNQTYVHLEIILINDGSIDNSEKIILSYNDERIVYKPNPKNLGLIKTLNRGIGLAKGKYIARIDADDIAYPTRIERQVEFMEKNPKTVLSGTFVQNIGTQSNKVSFLTQNEQIRFRMLFSTYVRHPSAIMRRDVLIDNDILYNEKYTHVEDHKMWLDIAEHGQVAILPEVLLKYRIHDENISIVHQKTQAKIETQIRKEQIEMLGIDVSDEEMKLYNFFIGTIKPENNQYLKGKIQKTKENIFALGDLINKMILKNNQIKMVSPAILNNVFSQKYWDIVSESTHLGMNLFTYYNRLEVIKYHSFTLGLKAKFWLRCLLKKKYT